MGLAVVLYELEQRLRVECVAGDDAGMAPQGEVVVVLGGELFEDPKNVVESFVIVLPLGIAEEGGDDSVDDKRAERLLPESLDAE